MDTTGHTTKKTDKLTIILRWVVIAAGVGLLIAAGWLLWAYRTSPEAIRQPAITHEHFRLQIIADGKPVDLSGPKFQSSYDKTICTGGLTPEPIHLHDGLDQYIHLHWKKVTGGMILKNYGWNLIGGYDNQLGFRFDKLPKLSAVPIHGQALPARDQDADYYVYTGDQQSFQARSWHEFLTQDLSAFLGSKPAPQQSWLNGLIPATSAHAGHGHAEGAAAATDDTKISGVLGNVVIFAQKERPTDEQVKVRFNALIPLPESTCGG